MTSMKVKNFTKGPSKSGTAKGMKYGPRGGTGHKTSTSPGDMSSTLTNKTHSYGGKKYL